MSSRPTRQLTWPFVLRTLARLNMMTRLDEWLAEEFVAKGVNVQGLGEYLMTVAEYMRGMGFDPNRHPNGNCAHCGEEIGCDHNGARYCSSRCRQRAYRLRLNKRGRQLKRHKAAVCDTSIRAESETNVTRKAPEAGTVESLA